MRIYLMGLMSCGKTTYGKLLSKQLDLLFVDLDQQIEYFYGTPISELFSKGEQFFRACENQILIKTIEEHEHAIIACGGGTPCFLNNIEIIKNSGKSFYLKTQPETIYQRLIKSHNLRPMFKSIPKEKWLDKIIEVLEIREPFYKQANYIIDGESNVIERILQCLKYDLDFKK